MKIKKTSVITILLSVILIVGVMAAFATSEIAPSGTVNTDALKVREGAVVDAAAAGLLMEGQKVTILSEENGFYHVSISDAEGDFDGWVRKEYVDID